MKFQILWANGQEFRDIRENFVIGRKHGDLQFADDDRMSGKHACFYVEKKQLMLVDLGSSNGTLVNGERIKTQQPVKLKNDDDVVMGGQKFQINIDMDSTTIDYRMPSEKSNWDTVKQDKTFVEASPLQRAPVAVAPAAVAPAPVNVAVPPSSPVSPSALLAPVTPAKVVEKPKVAVTVANAVEFKLPELPKRPVADVPAEEGSFVGVAPTEKPKRKFGKPLVYIMLAALLGAGAYVAMDKNNGTEFTSMESEVKTAQNKRAKPKPVKVEQHVASPSPASEETTAVNEIPATNPQLNQPEPEQAQLAPPTETSEKQIEVPSQTNLIAAPGPAPQPVKVKQATNTPKSSKTKKTIARKIIKKTTSAFDETALFTKLKGLKKDYRSLSTPRAKEALQVDAAEVVTQHYENLRQKIKETWKNSRSLASGERSRLKQDLLGRIVAINAREKVIKNGLHSYIESKPKAQ